MIRTALTLNWTHSANTANTAARDDNDCQIHRFGQIAHALVAGQIAKAFVLRVDEENSGRVETAAQNVLQQPAGITQPAWTVVAPTMAIERD